jgi:hypothetical protein
VPVLAWFCSVLIASPPNPQLMYPTGTGIDSVQLLAAEVTVPLRLTTPGAPAFHVDFSGGLSFIVKLFC